MTEIEETKYLEEMDNRPRQIYEALIKNARSLNIKYIPTNGSRNSLSFDFGKSDICKSLKKTFNISNSNFDCLFEQACSGSGGEKENFSILRSSALCAFLFFHNVSKIPVKISINNKKVSFNEVYFEIKNTVITRPSNIDIVLVSSDCKIILYLESKFAEYYLSNGSTDISTAYLNNKIAKSFYNDTILAKFNFFSNYKTFTIKRNGKEEEVFKVDSKPSENFRYKSYVEGIKQMISHYIGLYNFVNDKDKFFNQDSRNKKLKDLFDSGYSIYLGEIIFDFENNDNIKPFREDYKEKYKEFAKLINDKSKKTQIYCLPKVLYYSKFKDFINPTIRKYYFGD